MAVGTLMGELGLILAADPGLTDVVLDTEAVQASPSALTNIKPSLN